MKILMALLLSLTTLSSFALTRSEVDQLLKTRNLSLAKLESQGWQLLPGETTGHGFVEFKQVQAIFTSSQVIMKNEIDAASFSGQEILSSLQSLRFSGQYIMREDVEATMIKK